jgi:HD-GYP domain-containing protein (c-di-GMP phosphodiesterase class II)
MKKFMVAIVSILLLAGVLVADETENAAGEAKYYDNAKVIRIKNVEGEGFVQRSYDEGDEEATPNLPLFEKDTVGTTAGRLGIYLGRLNYLRLNSDTLVELLNIPQLRKTDFIVRIEKGAVYLDVENLDNEKSIQIQTPDCGVFLLDKGVYRINVDENSLTEVYVMEGIAEVAGQENSRNVRENQKIVMSRGKLEERPYYFYSSEKDDFDRWNETQNREQGYARYGSARYLQSGYEDYEYEMSRAGRWSYMSEFNSYVWTPYYSNADWMPYANGRWVYNPYYGYVWTSYDNCGWFTHHYGRWHWDYSSGWYWIPAYHWSPAWVSWFGDNDYYGWCPLSWWNRPVVIINNHWDHNYDYRRGIPHNSHSTIIIRKNELTAVHAQRVAISRNTQRSSAPRMIAYRGSAPSERLAVNKVTVINARGRAVAYKQNSIVSGEKYKISNNAGDGIKSAAGKAAVYKYNNSSDAKGKYSPRIYRSKDAEKNAETGTSKYFRSKTSSESPANTRARSLDSNSSGDKSQSEAAARGDSAGSVKSSSSESSATEEAKKKKDEAAYMALLQSENSAGYKSHATGSASNQGGYSAVSSSSSTNRHSYRTYESRTSSKSNASADYPQVAASRFSGAGETVSANSVIPRNGYASRSGTSADHNAVKEINPNQNYSTVSPRSRGYNANYSSHSYGNSSSSRAYTPAVRSNQASRIDNSSRSNTFSASARPSGRSAATTSSSNSTATRTAKKKN